MVRKDKEEGGGNQPFTDIVDSFASRPLRSWFEGWPNCEGLE
jgi:hypothetical protein